MKKQPISIEQALHQIAQREREIQALRAYVKSAEAIASLDLLGKITVGEKGSIATSKRGPAGVGKAVVQALESLGKFSTVSEITATIEKMGTPFTSLQVTKAMWRLSTDKNDPQVIKHPLSTKKEKLKFRWGLRGWIDPFTSEPYDDREEENPKERHK